MNFLILRDEHSQSRVALRKIHNVARMSKTASGERKRKIVNIYRQRMFAARDKQRGGKSCLAVSEGKKLHFIYHKTLENIYVVSYGCHVRYSEI